jgi:hypothetical protein
MTSSLLVSSVAMINTTRLVVAVPMQISFLGANQLGRELSLILALMKDHYKSQEKFQNCSGAASVSKMNERRTLPNFKASYLICNKRRFL